MGSKNIFEDYFNAYNNTSKSRDDLMLDIALRKSKYEQNLDEMWDNYMKGCAAQASEYQKGLDQIKSVGFKVLRNTKGKHKIVIPKK